MYSMVVVPLYDTLGPVVCQHIVNQGLINLFQNINDIIIIWQDNHIKAEKLNRNGRCCNVVKA